MRRLLTALLLLCLSSASFALAPYLHGDRIEAGDVAALMTVVERKLQAQGFTLLGRHQPRGLPQHGTVLVSDRELLAAVRAAGGVAIVAAAIRVGVQSDGTVSYMNPEYWHRAFLRGQYAAAEPAVQAVQARLGRALGGGAGFGGDVAAADLPNYRYMFGMERFDSSRNELQAHASFAEAVATVQANLAQGVGGTARVYEIVMPDQEIAVFGVAMNDAERGEGWWVNKIGADHVAALPYEIFVVGGKVGALYARYRIALAWPSLGMGQFMTIVNAPEAIRGTLARVAGAGTEKSAAVAR